MGLSGGIIILDLGREPACVKDVCQETPRVAGGVVWGMACLWHLKWLLTRVKRNLKQGAF